VFSQPANEHVGELLGKLPMRPQHQMNLVDQRNLAERITPAEDLGITLRMLVKVIVVVTHLVHFDLPTIKTPRTTRTLEQL